MYKSPQNIDFCFEHRVLDCLKCERDVAIKPKLSGGKTAFRCTPPPPHGDTHGTFASVRLIQDVPPNTVLRDCAEGGAGGALAPHLFANKINK